VSRLKIHFDGLCAFHATNIPPKDGNRPAKDEGNEMSVLLVDGRTHHHMPHKPVLSVVEGATTSGDTSWDLNKEHLDLFWVDGQGNETPLASDSLEIVRDQRVYFDDGEAANAFPMDAEEAEDFSWVPSIGQVAKGLSLDPESKNLVARLALTEGKLKVTSLVQDQNGMISAFEFTDQSGKNTLRQALAQGAVAEIEMPDDAEQVKVVFSKLGTTNETRSVLLKPSTPGGNVEIELANTPADEVDIRHFAMFYDLVTGRGHKPVPGKSKTNRRMRSPGASGSSLRPMGTANPDACPFVQGP